MIDPQRLKDGSVFAFDRAMLESASDDAASKGAEERALVALGLSATVGATLLASSTAKGSKLAFAVVAKWVGIGALAIGSVTTAYVLASSPKAASPPIAPTAVAAPTVASPTVASVPPAAPSAEIIEPATTEAPPSIPVPRSPTATKRQTPPPPRASAQLSISEELDVLDRARSALATHDVVAARSALDDYQTRFAHGSLAEEAELARIDLFLQEGRKREAEEGAKRFLVTHPSSSYRKRVSALLTRATNSR